MGSACLRRWRTLCAGRQTLLSCSARHLLPPMMHLGAAAHCACRPLSLEVCVPAVDCHSLPRHKTCQSHLQSQRLLPCLLELSIERCPRILLKEADATSCVGTDKLSKYCTHLPCWPLAAPHGAAPLRADCKACLCACAPPSMLQMPPRRPLAGSHSEPLPPTTQASHHPTGIKQAEHTQQKVACREVIRAKSLVCVTCAERP